MHKTEEWFYVSLADLRKTNFRCNNWKQKNCAKKKFEKENVFVERQEALKGFTTGPFVTSQTQTSPRFSRLQLRLFQIYPKFLGYSTHVTRSVTMRQYFNFSVTLLRYGLKILTDSSIEGVSLGYPDHPPRKYHPGRQPTFIHFFTNALKCLHGRLAGSATYPGHSPACPVVTFLGKLNLVS